MASHPGSCTVEAYVGEAWYNITAEQKAFIISVYEKNPELKSYIERNMEDFEEEEQSWRDYRNSMGSNIDGGYPNERLLIDYFIKYGSIR